jgi:hypothetical protein
VVAAQPLNSRRSFFDEHLLWRRSTATNGFDATVHDKMSLRVLEVRELTMNQIEISSRSIGGGGEHYVVDSGDHW